MTPESDFSLCPVHVRCKQAQNRLSDTLQAKLSDAKCRRRHSEMMQENAGECSSSLLSVPHQLCPLLKSHRFRRFFEGSLVSKSYRILRKIAQTNPWISSLEAENHRNECQKIFLVGFYVFQKKVSPLRKFRFFSCFSHVP